MLNSIKIICFLSTAVLLSEIIMPASSFAATGGRKICGMNGCTRPQGDDNGTVFCDYHAAEYAKELL